LNEGIIATIGHTPLIKLSRLFPKAHFQLFAKLETANPGGSIKDRPAYNILSRALERRQIRPGTTVIESSSGNMGIGLAQMCAYYGLRFICVVDPKTTNQNLEILRVYGAQIDLVDEPDPVTGEYLQARIARVQYLLQHIPDSFWPNQYANADNAAAHYGTMHEIVTQTHGEVDIVLCATSTCGTLRGCADYVRQHRLSTKIYAVDAVGSVIFGHTRARRLIPGHGASRRPELFDQDAADRSILVSDLDCVVGCRRLLRREAILAGGSSGGIVAALDSIQDSIPLDSICVAIICDRGERYLDTIYSDEWVGQHFGDGIDLW
jgi:N-(2-amino-2-carboxyethyl)-L-glutamate synthase